MRSLKLACVGVMLVSALVMLGSRTIPICPIDGASSPAIERIARVVDGIPIPPIPKITRVA